MLTIELKVWVTKTKGIPDKSNQLRYNSTKWKTIRESSIY